MTHRAFSTYATAGAAFGYGMLWTVWVCLSLMAAVQLMCARIGLVSGRGLAAVLRRYYSRRIWANAEELRLARTDTVINAI